MALGAEIISGFELIAEELGLAEAIADADLVITGEGELDRESFAGKVVGGGADLCDEGDTPMLIVAGAVGPDHGGLPDGATAISLSERYGLDQAIADPCGLAAQAVADWFAANEASSA